MSYDESFLPAAVGDYIQRTIPAPYPVMERVEREVEKEGQPAVGRQTGSLLRSLALVRGAERILEVGTNLGYSGLWLCAGLAPRGTFEGIEIDEKLAARAEANLREAIEERAVVHRGAALDVMQDLPASSYDLVFLDAVKAEYPAYLGEALRLLKTGGIVAADNMLWHGNVWDPKARDADTEGVREYTRRIFAEPRLTSTIVPIEDGLGISVLVG